MVRDQHPAARECDASNQDIIRTDPLAAPFQVRADSGRPLGRRARERQNLKRAAEFPAECQTAGGVSVAVSSEESFGDRDNRERKILARSRGQPFDQGAVFPTEHFHRSIGIEQVPAHKAGRTS